MTEQLTYDKDIITVVSEDPLSGGTDPERGNDDLILLRLLTELILFLFLNQLWQ